MYIQEGPPGLPKVSLLGGSQQPCVSWACNVPWGENLRQKHTWESLFASLILHPLVKQENHQLVVGGKGRFLSGLVHMCRGWEIKQKTSSEQAPLPAPTSLLIRSNLESWQEMRKVGEGHMKILHDDTSACMKWAKQALNRRPYGEPRSAVQQTETLKELIRPAHCPERGDACLITGFPSRGPHPRLPATFLPGQSWKPQPEGQASSVPGQHAALSLAAIWSPILPNVCSRP